MLCLQNKKALVTGASSGIGKSIALALGKAGCDVALIGRDIGRLNSTANDISAANPSAKLLPIPADVTIEHDVRNVVCKCAETFGGVDYLVNCAGISQRKGYKIEEIDMTDYQRMMQTNVDSMLYFTQAAMPHLKQSAGAYIINILSTSAFNSSGGGGMYSASKYAARALHESMEAGCKGSNIKVSAISPGPVLTNIWSHKEEEVSEKRKEHMLRPENIADIVLFLLTIDPNVHIGNITVEPWFYVKGK